MTMFRFLAEMTVECPAVSFLRLGLRRDYECKCLDCGYYVTKNRMMILNSLKDLETFEIWRYTEIILSLNGPPITHPGYAWMSKGARQSDRMWESLVHDAMPMRRQQDENISQDKSIT